MEEHDTNGQQEQQGNRDPRAFPAQKSWAEVIAESNRRCVCYMRQDEEQKRKIGSLLMQLDEAKATIARQDDQIAGLFLALGFEVEADLNDHQQTQCEAAPFPGEIR